MLTEADCLPTGKDEEAEIEVVIDAINQHLIHNEITLLEDGKASIGGYVFDTELLYCYQNNEHHEEGWLYNHIIGMLIEKSVGKWRSNYIIGEADESILEIAIVFSDLGKLSTLKDSPKKTWEDGTPQSTAFGHDKASAKLLAEAWTCVKETNRDWHSGDAYKNFIAIHWIVEEHMNAHKLAEMDEQGKTTIPDWLMPQVEGLEAWDWPEWADLEIPHGANMGKKAYAWIRRGASILLRIKQECDEYGRISKQSFN